MTVLKLQGFVWKPGKCDWMAKVVFLKQMLPAFGGSCNRCFLRYSYFEKGCRKKCARDNPER